MRGREQNYRPWTSGKPYTPKKKKDESSTCSSVFADRKLGAQPLMYSAPGAQTPVWNVPKLGKLPYHMTCAGDMWAELEATLMDVSFLEAKAEGGLLFTLRVSHHSSVVSFATSKKARVFDLGYALSRAQMGACA